MTALIGVVIGGMIGFFTNRALQEHESETAARGAARVYQARLLQVADELTTMIEMRRAFDPRQTIPPDLELDDKRLMASELSADQWADILRSESSLAELLTIKTLTNAPDEGKGMSPVTCTILRDHLPPLIRGVDALAGLSDFDLPADQRGAYSEPAC